MVDLKSVEKPPHVGLGAEMAQVRKVADGSSGTASDEASRAARSFLKVGKSESPIPRPPSALETVIGPDDRIRIVDTDLDPWRMICALELFGPGGGSAVGTGWLAGPRTIVTAGHCVHHMPFFGGWAARIRVSAGRDDAEFPFGTIEATRFSALDRWVESADPDFDIGCIHLEEPLGDTTGFFSYAALPPAELASFLINISGYPADRGNGTMQFFHANRVLHVGDRRVFYDTDTFGGQSGSPVWIHEAEGAPPQVVGIHAYGTGGTPFNLGITANSAPRIIPEVFDIITGWVEADNAAGNAAAGAGA